MADFCGTGFGNFPKPGDPDNNSVLSARAMFGGIMVSWTYPNLNPHAVAHTILYRSTNDNPATKVRHRIVTGDTWFDTFEGLSPLTYYYWIEIVSVNGTIGEAIGPASATVEPTTYQMLQMLTGEINESVLGQALRSKIEEISFLDGKLSNEIEDRIANIDLMGTLLNQVQDDMAAVDTALVTETVERIQGQSALVTQIDAIMAQSGDNSAALAAERIVRADADSALASDINLVSATAGENRGLILDEQIARADGDSALSQDILSLAAIVGDNSAAIQTEQTARVDGDEALSQLIISLQGVVGDNSAAIQTESQARADGDGALATQISTLQSTVGDNTALIQTVQQVTNGVAAQYMVKSDVNGYVTGFGLYNDGGSSQFLVDADRFAVGKLGESGVLPFIIDNGIVYLNEVRVVGAQIDELYADRIIGGTITAAVELKAAAITGGSININNRFTVSSTGVVTISNATTGSRLEIHNDVIKVWERVGNVDRLRVKLGNLNA